MGMDIDSLLCSTCNKDVESFNHMFVMCNTTMKIWVEFTRWWKVNLQSITNYNEFEMWVKQLHLTAWQRYSTTQLTFWAILRLRNYAIFGI